MKQSQMTPEFVEFIPDSLEAGVIYISTAYATASHLCACGCGNKVVTPLGPAEWELIFDGERVSLFPSVGNWQFPCRSHYWIWRNTVSWSAQWTDEQIEAGRTRDECELKSYFDRRVQDTPPPPPRMSPATAPASLRDQEPTPPRAERGLRARLSRLFGRG